MGFRGNITSDLFIYFFFPHRQLAGRRYILLKLWENNGKDYFKATFDISCERERGL